MKLRIEELRKEKGVSVNKLASECGVSRQMINNYLTQSSVIPYEKVYKIAEVLQCEVMELIEAPKGFTHVYTSQGLWLGIQREIN